MRNSCALLLLMHCMDVRRRDYAFPVFLCLRMFIWSGRVQVRLSGMTVLCTSITSSMGALQHRQGLCGTASGRSRTCLSRDFYVWLLTRRVWCPGEVQSLMQGLWGDCADRNKASGNASTCWPKLRSRRCCARGLHLTFDSLALARCIRPTNLQAVPCLRSGASK